MKENMISKIIKCIGIVTIALGSLAFLIIGANAENGGIVIGGIVGSFISGVMFIGFAEVINLLQQSVDKQNNILNKIKTEPQTTVEPKKDEPRTVLQDIESNLPNI